MARQATIIGSIIDYQGNDWDVRERRATTHGFDLYLGWPTLYGESQRGQGYGGPRLIPTGDLYRYWQECGIKRDGSIYDLPACKTAIKHLRRTLGFDFYTTYDQWWIDHLDDLRSLSRMQFARKYAVDPIIVGIQRKRRLIGQSDDAKLKQIRLMRGKGMSLRAIGHVVGLSYERVRQLLGGINTNDSQKRKKLVSAWRAKGLCACCGKNPARANKTTCGNCAQKARVRYIAKSTKH